MINATNHPARPPSDAAQIIINYESLSSITSQMRNAANQGEWEQLVNLGQQCSQHVSTMKPLDISVKLDEDTRQRKIQLIKRILADDAEIRNCTEVWMEQLRNIMHSNRQEQRLRQVYGA